jgi:hypothetical protein
MEQARTVSLGRRAHAPGDPKLTISPAGNAYPWLREVYVPGHIKERDRRRFTA